MNTEERMEIARKMISILEKENISYPDAQHIVNFEIKDAFYEVAKEIRFKEIQFESRDS